MKNVVAAALVACVSAVALAVAQTPAPVASRRAGPAGSATSPGPAVASAKADGLQAKADAAAHREWLNKYCVSCHSTRTPLPANDPLKLDTANLDEVTKDEDLSKFIL